MATYSPPHSDKQDQTIVWALVLSVGLHLLALTQIPNIEFERETAKPDTLTVELLPPPAPPQPVSEPEPEPIPEPPKPEIKPKPEKKPVIKEAPSPVVEPPSKVTEERPPAPPPVMTAAPKAETPPVVTAPPPPPPPEPPKGPSQADIDDARNLYGGLLTREIAKHKQYPNVARMRGWQGEAMLELRIDGNGNLLSSRIVTSSGYEVLDKQGLEMVRKASPFPPPPDALRGRNFEILVPVSFKLE